MIKLTSTFIVLTFFSFLVSCADDDQIDTEAPKLTIIRCSNDTSDSPHNFLCSEGKTMSFSIRSGDQFVSKEISERGSAQIKMDIKEGDLLNIEIRDTDGNLMLSREKTFSPSNPEAIFPKFPDTKSPYIIVCDTRVLEIVNF